MIFINLLVIMNTPPYVLLSTCNKDIKERNGASPLGTVGCVSLTLGL